MTIGSRIKHAREAKGFTQKQFAEVLGLDSSQLSKIERNMLLPTLTQVMEIGSKLDYSMDYIILGRNENADVLNEPTSHYDVKTIPPVIDIVPSGMANVVILPAKSAASDFTRALTDPIYYNEGFRYETMSLPQLQYRKGPFFATEIEGDSMHSTLTHGELLIGNPIPTTEFNGGHIFTLYHKIHGLITKRLYWKDKENGIVLMTCDNEDLDDQESLISDISPYMLKGICSVNFNLRNWNNDVRREIRDLRNDVQSIRNSLNMK